MGTLSIGTAISIAAALSFLGLGIAPATPTLGGMIKAGMPYLSGASLGFDLPWFVVIVVMVISFKMLGDGMRDITGPKLRI